MYVSSAPCLLRVVSIIVTSRRLRRYIQIIPLLVLMSSVIRSTVYVDPATIYSFNMLMISISLTTITPAQ